MTGTQRRARASGAAADAAQRPGASILGPQWLILEDFPSAALTRTLSPNGRAHWAARSKAADVVRNAVWLAVVEHGTRPVRPPVRITYRWVFPDRRRRDVDNYSTGVIKVVQDRLVSLGILTGDHAAVLSMTVEIVMQQYRRALEIRLEPAATTTSSSAGARDGGA